MGGDGVVERGLRFDISDSWGKEDISGVCSVAFMVALGRFRLKLMWRGRGMRLLIESYAACVLRGAERMKRLKV